MVGMENVVSSMDSGSCKAFKRCVLPALLGPKQMQVDIFDFTWILFMDLTKVALVTKVY